MGDPNQAIYGWRGASVSNILNFDDTFPGGAGTTAPIHHLTVNRRSDTRILDVANLLAAPLYAKYPQVEELEPDDDVGEGEVTTSVFDTHAEELAALVAGVTEAHTELWSKIAVLTRDNAHAEDVFDALTGAGIPVEIVGLSGLLRLPEVAEVVAILHLMHDVTSNTSLLTLLTGPRWAIGPRDLRLLSGGRRSWPATADGERLPTPSLTSSSASRTASTLRRFRRSTTRWSTPATRRTRRRRGSGSACWRASSGSCAPTSASRCSTSCGGSSTSPASTSSSRLRCLPPRRRVARTSTCSSRRWRSSKRSTATSPCPRCWPT